jgi:hypothetical protein
MPDTITLPGLGPTKKMYVYAGAGVLVVAVGIYYYRKRQGGGGAGSGAVDPSTIDPATGFPEGSPEDLQALAAMENYAPGQSVGISGPPSGQTPTYTYPSATYATNDAWTQGATDYLVNVEDQSAANVGPALAKYLAGEPVTPAQKVIIEMAEAIAGKPPIPGANGYPPSIKELPAPTTVKLATPHLSRSGGGKLGAHVKLSWTKVPNATYYTLYRNGIANQNIVGLSYSYVESHRNIGWTVAARGGTGTHFTISSQSNKVIVP